jgi:hypothetical protein
MDEYKKAIFDRYEKIKFDVHSDLLEKPTTAKLKDLCQRLFDTLSEDDKKIYIRFFKIDSLEYNKIKEFDNDKFRPIVRFLKGGVPPTNQVSVELIAILVGQDLRPFQKFRKLALTDEKQLDSGALQPIVDDSLTEREAEVDFIESHNIEEDVFLQEGSVNDETVTIEKENILNEDISINKTRFHSSVNESKIAKVEAIPQKYFTTGSSEKRKLANRLMLLLLGIASINVILFALKGIFVENEGCMVWRGDHYEAVACDTQINTFAGNSIIPLNKDLLMYQRKLNVSDTTTFFNADDSPKVWYGKLSNNRCEFFSYPGKHPETGKELKKTTHYIVEKYVKNKAAFTP